MPLPELADHCAVCKSNYYLEVVVVNEMAGAWAGTICGRCRKRVNDFELSLVDHFGNFKPEQSAAKQSSTPKSGSLLDRKSR